MARSDTVTQILDAAGQVFAEKGFKAATVREICAQAGVNLAAVNYHFGDKERLYIEAVKDARKTLEDNVPLPTNFDAVDPEEALRMFIRTLALRMLDRNVESWRHELLVREFTNPSRACEEIMHESIMPFIDRLHGIIRRAISSDVPDHTVRQLAFSMISQCAYYRLQDRVVAMLTPPEQLERYFTAECLADHVTRFSIAAIRSYNSVDSVCET